MSKYIKEDQELDPQNYNIDKYSSNLIRRGLELANILVQDQIKLVDLDPQEIAKNLLKEGIYYQRLGLHQESINSYSQAIAYSPKYVDAYILRCAAYIGCMNFLPALEDYQAAYQIDEMSVKNFTNIEEGVQEILDLLVYIGNSYYDLENYKRSIEIYTDILSFIPSHSNAYSRRSSARSAMKDYQGAIEDLQNSREPYMSQESISFPDWLKFADFAFRVINEASEFFPELPEQFRKSFQEGFQKLF